MVRSDPLALENWTNFDALALENERVNENADHDYDYDNVWTLDSRCDWDCVCVTDSGIAAGDSSFNPCSFGKKGYF